MAEALSAPCAVAALLLALAGAGKLRRPGPAAVALAWPPAAVRAFAVGEITLAIWALGWASPLAEGMLALLYVAFAAVGIALGRRGRACGCFGVAQGPVAPVQIVLSCVLAGVSAGGWAAGPHAVGWMASRAPVLLPAVAAAAYAGALLYSQLPALWRSWSGP